MNRIQIIQRLINENNYESYLEIGTYKGESLFPLKCKKKIAVDPDFQISRRDKLKWMWKNRFNIANQYYEMTSDKFFESHKKSLAGGIDLVFIDGLHTFNASLNDCLNSLKYLNKHGVIVMHDCFPPNKAAATPAKSIENADTMQIEGWKKEWCGDVWKTIIYLKQQYKEELEVLVLNTDYGLGIIRPKLKQSCSITINENLYNRINALDYEYLISNPQEFLGLKEINGATNFL